MPRPGQVSNNNTNEVYSDFSRRQKTAIIFVAVLALLIVAFWLLQINQQIRKPFQSPDKKTESAITELDLSLSDSDSDGLNDYDELNVYKTSPYLEDTDSDGISDYDEVSQGTDPNCQTGKNCYGSEIIINQDTPTDTNPLYLSEENTDSNSAVSESAGGEGIINPAEVTPEILRQVLLESGYEADVLKEISDEDLMASYQEALRLGSESEPLQ